jgi:O-antigen ligase
MRLQINKSISIIYILLTALFISGLWVVPLIFQARFEGYRAVIVLALLTPLAYLLLLNNHAKLEKIDFVYVFLQLLLLAYLSFSPKGYGVTKLRDFAILNLTSSFLVLIIYKGQRRGIAQLINFLPVFSLGLGIYLISVNPSFSDWQTGFYAWQIRQDLGRTIGFSRILGLGIIILFIKIHNESGVKKYFHFFISFILVILQFFLLQRGPFYSTMLTLGLAWVILSQNRQKITKLVIVSLAFLLIYNLISNIIPRYQFANIVNDPRTLLIDHAWNLWLENPIFGVGLGGYPVGLSLFGVHHAIGSDAYPHNIFLEFLSEGGLIGLSLFLSFLFIIVVKLKSILVINSDSTSFLLLLLFIFSILNAQVSSDITGNNLIWIVGSLIIAYPRLVKINKEKRSISNCQKDS